jgi:hypothetical protein
LKAKGVIVAVPNVWACISPYSEPWNERVEDEGIAVEDLVDDIFVRHTPKIHYESMKNRMSIAMASYCVIFGHTRRRYLQTIGNHKIRFD